MPYADPARRREACRLWRLKNPQYHATYSAAYNARPARETPSFTEQQLGRARYNAKLEQARRWRMAHPGYMAAASRKWRAANPNL